MKLFFDKLTGLELSALRCQECNSLLIRRKDHLKDCSFNQINYCDICGEEDPILSYSCNEMRLNCKNCFNKKWKI